MDNRNFLAISTVLIINMTSMAQAQHFEGDLILRDVADQYDEIDDYDIGHTEFELLSDYTFVDAEGTRHTVPSGTVVNGASIPRVVWSVVGGPWSGRYRNAAVIHDYMTETTYETSKITHRIFYDAMIANSTDRVKALTMYYAVLEFGPQWTIGSGLVGTPEAEMMTSDELEAIRRKIEAEDLDRADIETLVDATE